MENAYQESLYTKVTRCVCAKVSLLEVVKQYRTLETVQKETGCATFCKLCLPYLIKRLSMTKDENS